MQRGEIALSAQNRPAGSGMVGIEGRHSATAQSTPLNSAVGKNFSTQPGSAVTSKALTAGPTLQPSAEQDEDHHHIKRQKVAADSGQKLINTLIARQLSREVRSGAVKDGLGTCLQSLTFTNCRLGRQNMELLARGLARAKGADLRELSLHFSETLERLLLVSFLLTFLPNGVLRKLQLRGNGIGAGQLAFLLGGDSRSTPRLSAAESQLTGARATTPATPATGGRNVATLFRTGNIPAQKTAGVSSAGGASPGTIDDLADAGGNAYYSNFFEYNQRGQTTTQAIAEEGAHRLSAQTDLEQLLQRIKIACVGATDTNLIVTGVLENAAAEAAEQRRLHEAFHLAHAPSAGTAGGNAQTSGDGVVSPYSNAKAISRPMAFGKDNGRGLNDNYNQNMFSRPESPGGTAAVGAERHGLTTNLHHQTQLVGGHILTKAQANLLGAPAAEEIETSTLIRDWQARPELQQRMSPTGAGAREGFDEFAQNYGTKSAFTHSGLPGASGIAQGQSPDMMMNNGAYSGQGAEGEAMSTQMYFEQGGYGYGNDSTPFMAEEDLIQLQQEKKTANQKSRQMLDRGAIQLERRARKPLAGFPRRQLGILDHPISVIQKLILSENGLGDAGCIVLAQNWGRSRFLQELRLDDNGITSLGARILASRMAQVRLVVSSDVGTARTGSDGARYEQEPDADALPEYEPVAGACPQSLELLSLKHNPAIGRDGAEILASSMFGVSALRCLDLRESMGTGVNTTLLAAARAEQQQAGMFRSSSDSPRPPPYAGTGASETGESGSRRFDSASNQTRFLPPSSSSFMLDQRNAPSGSSANNYTKEGPFGATEQASRMGNSNYSAFDTNPPDIQDTTNFQQNNINTRGVTFATNNYEAELRYKLKHAHQVAEFITKIAQSRETLSRSQAAAVLKAEKRAEQAREREELRALARVASLPPHLRHEAALELAKTRDQRHQTGTSAKLGGAPYMLDHEAAPQLPGPGALGREYHNELQQQRPQVDGTILPAQGYRLAELSGYRGNQYETHKKTHLSRQHYHMFGLDVDQFLAESVTGLKLEQHHDPLPFQPDRMQQAVFLSSAAPPVLYTPPLAPAKSKTKKM
ncbi:unnamed protein product [Amoebophrya sp. A25]|nr:unnamed protein product [Amoebophrya sp. A25]|eukprot:GSA25T00026620001.1